jgi:hypothetical protein
MYHDTHIPIDVLVGCIRATVANAQSHIESRSNQVKFSTKGKSYKQWSTIATVPAAVGKRNANI